MPCNIPADSALTKSDYRQARLALAIHLTNPYSLGSASQFFALALLLPGAKVMSPYGRFERSPGAEFVTRDQDLPGDAANPALLEQVLRQTLAAMTASQRVAPAEMEALKAVGMRHEGQSLDETIATELVLAVLGQQPDASGGHSPVWQRTSLRVAQLLMDDPEAHARLLRMWAEISGGNP